MARFFAATAYSTLLSCLIDKNAVTQTIYRKKSLFSVSGIQLKVPRDENPLWQGYGAATSRSGSPSRKLSDHISATTTEQREQTGGRERL